MHFKFIERNDALSYLPTLTNGELEGEYFFIAFDPTDDGHEFCAGRYTGPDESGMDEAVFPNIVEALVHMESQWNIKVVKDDEYIKFLEYISSPTSFLEG